MLRGTHAGETCSCRLSFTHGRPLNPGQESQGKPFSFYRDLLPTISRWASDTAWASRPLPLLERGRAGRVVLPRAWIRCLNSNAFLLNTHCLASNSSSTPEEVRLRCERSGEDTFPKHSWVRVFSQPRCQVSIAKVTCLLAYFAFSSGTEAADGGQAEGVTVERLQSAAGFDDYWAVSSVPVDTRAVNVHTGAMESTGAEAFVDFANRFVGYRAIIPSMTQEEVLWCMAPELMPSSLICEAMTDDEAVVVRGVRRVSAYSGYLGSCRWEGFWRGPGSSPSAGPPLPDEDIEGARMDVLVMDAMVSLWVYPLL